MKICLWFLVMVIVCDCLWFLVLFYEFLMILEEVSSIWWIPIISRPDQSLKVKSNSERPCSGISSKLRGPLQPRKSVKMLSSPAPRPQVGKIINEWNELCNFLWNQQKTPNIMCVHIWTFHYLDVVIILVVPKIDRITKNLDSTQWYH